MVYTIASFEFSQRLRRISTYVYFLVFVAMGCFFGAIAGGAIPGSSIEFGTGGKVLVNSPFALNTIISYVTFFGLVITAAIAGQATYQDVHTNSTAFFYTAPITKFDYLAGRYLGALAIQIGIFTSVGVGAWVATHLPWMDPTRIGPHNIAAYIQPYLILVIPNLIFTTAIFFGLAALARKMLPVYAASVLLLIGYFVAAQLSTNLSINVQAALADPLGGNAVERITQYWTPFERNTRLIPLQGILLLNRLLWLALGAAVLAFTYARFSLSEMARSGKKRKPVANEEEIVPPVARALPIAHPIFSAGASLRQFLSLTRIHFTETVKNVFFGVLLLAGGLFAALSANGINSPLSTVVYPVTYRMLQDGGGGFGIFALVIIIFYSGELVWRERDAQLSQIVDALPVQRWVLFSSKLSALMLVQVLLVLVILAAGLIVQVSHGYYRFEFALYLKELLGVRLINFWILCILALLVHTIVNNKYLGHFVMALYIVATLALPALGLEHYLYRFGQVPPFIYSDMNKYGPFAAPLFWFRLYWAIAAILLAIVINVLWVRGTESNWRVRLGIAKARFAGPVIVVLAVGALAFLGVGSYIFYNTNILNPYRTTYGIDDARAQYEKKYQQYKDLLQPRITDVNTEIDLYPAKRSVLIHGTMMLENKTSANIDQVALTVWPVDLIPLPMPQVQIRQLALSD